ncbi:hypothetical protein N7G274_003238 [Stereocaulon virgatum]|uniref:Uncharacterized protein n=1 Tax=Stereocaulon virgatum TaxID=373712 RepID=A0ABR4AE35_9LECA
MVTNLTSLLLLRVKNSFACDASDSECSSMFTTFSDFVHTTKIVDRRIPSTAQGHQVTMSLSYQRQLANMSETQAITYAELRKHLYLIGGYSVNRINLKFERILEKERTVDIAVLSF